jgi:prolyl-tRNA editing enzyme YbaK/EbsC (Cys-tRNA(Pro) deacylase)
VSDEPTEERSIEVDVLAALDATGVPYETIEIDPDLADTATFCARYGYPLETSGNCILVASKDRPPVLAACLALATTKLDVNKRVRKLLGVRKLSFAPAELTREVTGMEIGGVTPFGLPNVARGHAAEGPWAVDLPLLVDARIAELDRVIVGGGSRSLKLSVPPEALARVGARFVEDLAVELV